ncbi:MAG TPA: hypothetical protein PKE23_04075 [Anaerolineales bacterium]|nr:hypothetical protein [Anaerolineales bacterium]
MSKKYLMQLGVKLTAAEHNALLKMAEREGLHKSVYARQTLRAHMIAQGVLTVHNPAPEVDEITAQVRHE